MDGVILSSGTLLDPGTQPDLSWNVAVTRDFNRDGKTDILWRHATGGIVVWYMDGNILTTGTFATPPTIESSWRLVGPR